MTMSSWATSGFAEFMFKHKIPATAAAFSIGGASAEMAKCLSHTILVPTLYASLSRFIEFKNPAQFAIKPFAESFISWVCVLVTSYVLMELLFARTILGASTTVMSANDRAELKAAIRDGIDPIKKATDTVKRLMSPASVSGVTSHVTSLYPIAAGQESTVSDRRKSNALVLQSASVNES